MTPFEAVLAVQDHDTALDRLRHRRSHLPERRDLAAAGQRSAALEAALAEAGARRGEVVGRQSRLEEAAGAVDRRIREMEARLYSGEVTATRELLAMTGEIESLKRRRASLDEEMLAALEEEEPLAAEVEGLEAGLAAAAAEVARLRSALAEAERAVDAEAEAEAEARAGAAASVADGLLSTYEALRARLGGVGAARLVGASCSGCHLTLPAQELARIRREAPDALVLCDQCGRILVR